MGVISFHLRSISGCDLAAALLWVTEELLGTKCLGHCQTCLNYRHAIRLLDYHKC